MQDSNNFNKKLENLKDCNDFEPTIVAISTALSKSAISIVRMSGNKALEIAYKLLNSKTPLSPRVATLRNIYDEKNELIDNAIIIYFKAPKSYTGEDLVEIQSHGGSIIANDILKMCLFYGATLAEPGEFSKRALKNGKLDLIKLDSIISLINSKNANFRALLTRNLCGKLESNLESVRVKLLEIIAQIEVNIDYAEEELDSNILNISLKNLQNIESNFKNIIDSTTKYNKLQNLNLCILGRPNVGKSSILNMLLNENRAIVSDIAGTTRDAISEYIDICGNLIKIIDTAGIRDSKDSIESQGIQKSFEFANKSDILLCIFDISSEMTKDDFKILEFLDSLHDKFILIILNKVDLEHKNTYEFPNFEVLKISTKEASCANILKDKISQILTFNIDKDTLILTNHTQKLLLESALQNIQTAITLLPTNALELTSLELTNALQNISQITKPYNVEEMLDSMFSQFCVGK
ncbi:tRNA uridine-5-carboxymethylaminomethyl(34) synthesis GTPase MnmE [Helicobacter saguini]|uniref:tRNA modification GTPase MnmE n=2 Tax=Helicobacter saguini TaxID=1548018 RepID=A0A347VMU3_9HELI|nr:tRNA uridine-5-carboxymethylaminomethyl(34) synthesis GTPase MnmE [Helicobacter saguini]MWV67558.1 tRNA uridine-5-carboxymethylaminomethyl(34) synthesis GTPase MnmE [Helicobacter saguini]MWV69909.1 tRNA uridine-5-carboxymethylaminomethyl(34) synthesis GTPase MnmE [Helicobacter saguini]MWV72876.1 tRNA uridine-5-carboxymethylaminomethyl(34) synthesis GTPase MnmE [Helicobacter saguini]TLD93280.1 tRNA uridine-5-carboxymethylaminomethyl(34) synthesis GTPase MnmE [Helicobacter saguini]